MMDDYWKTSITMVPSWIFVGRPEYEGVVFLFNNFYQTSALPYLWRDWRSLHQSGGFRVIHEAFLGHVQDCSRMKLKGFSV